MAVSIESKIGDLLANPKAKAVLDKHLPGFSTNPQMAMAKGMSLKMVAPMSGGKITPALLKAVDEDLKKIV
jgi:hypothetical protein